MKKSVIVLIALIYVASIALVSFLGLQFKVFEQIVYVDKVEITNEGQKYSEQFGDYVVIYPNANGEWKYQINYRVYPDEATNSDVTFEITSSGNCATVDQNGIVTFTKSGSAKIFVVAANPGNDEETQDTITIIARKAK